MKNISIIGGIGFACLASLFLPETFPHQNEVIATSWEMRAVAFLTVLMAVWWMTEPIPVYATAMLPIVALPLLGVSPIKVALARYSDPILFLFLGGFLLGIGLQKTGLHRRLALNTLRLFGERARNIVAGFMLVTAAMSMWISNTATAMMMVPIAISMIQLWDSQQRTGSQFSVCLVLSIAYAASIGGMATLIGSPTNAFVASFCESQLNRPIEFADWFQAGLPVVIVLLPISWWLLTTVLFPMRNEALSASQKFLATELQKLGKICQAEWVVLVLFLLTAIAWINRPWLSHLEIGDSTPFRNLSDTSIAISAAILLFLLPDKGWTGERVLKWEDTKEIPWGVLILFGGGLTLATSIQTSGLGDYLGSVLSNLQEVPSYVTLLVVITLVVFMTELTSNTATVTAVAPVLVSLSVVMEMDPLMLLIPAGLAGSCAFMLPVATPPNAIVYGTHRVTMRQMIFAGSVLNLVSILVLFLLSLWLGD